MDELISQQELFRLEKSSHRRVSNKCFRCKQRRLQCSFKFPKCDKCTNYGVDCDAWVSAIDRPLPRSIPIYLENRIADLEIQLEELKSHRLINADEEHATAIIKCAILPFKEGFTSNENDETLGSSMYAMFDSTNLPPPFDSILENGKRGTMKSFIKRHPPIKLSTIPKNAVSIMMSNYIDFHLPQMPIIPAPTLTTTYIRVLDQSIAVSAYEQIIVLITMSISAALITSQSEKKALSSSSALFSSAISKILNIVWESKMQKLEVLLLIAHYAFANPFAANIWYVLRTAFRLCIDMGLHQNIDSELLTVADADARRRLFLVCSGMLRHFSSVMRIPFPMSLSSVSAEYPTIIDDSYISENRIDYSGPKTKAAALHFYSFRLCESEICDVLWNNKEIGHSDISEWVESIEKKVEKWYVKAEEFAKVNQLRFRLICKASLQIRLRRRTPRVPKPSHKTIVQLIEACDIHLAEYNKDVNSGQVSYLLMGTYYIEEVAVNILDVMWFESDWIESFYTISCLNDRLINCLNLLRKFGERWPDIIESNMLTVIDELRDNVLQKFSSTESQSGEICDKITNQINHLMFPDNKANPISNRSSPRASVISETNIPIELRIVEDVNFKGLLSLDTSDWQDHFIDDSFWNLQDLTNQVGGYI